MSKLYLIRHAQASFLSKDYDNLSEHGQAQSKVLGDYFANKTIRFDKIYVGPLKRHRQTYEQVKLAYQEKGIAIPEAIEIEELREYVGMSNMAKMNQQLSKNHPKFKQWFKEMEEKPNPHTKMKMIVAYLRMWATDTLGFDLPADVQTFANFRKTAEIGLQKVIQGNENGQTIAAFSSGGCIAAMMSKVMGVPDPGKTIGFNLVMLNTAISEVLFSDSRLSVLNFNTLPHLQEEMITTM